MERGGKEGMEEVDGGKGDGLRSGRKEDGEKMGRGTERKRGGE